MNFEVAGSIEEVDVRSQRGRAMKVPNKPFALCIDNAGHQASLIPAKVYRILSDPRAAKDDLVRIVDESGEDYLYHRVTLCSWIFRQRSRRKSLRWSIPS